MSYLALLLSQPNAQHLNRDESCNSHRATSLCRATYGYVFVAGPHNTEPQHHTAFEFRKSPFDAAADRREAACASSSSHRALRRDPAGRHIERHSWTEFQLAEGDYDEIERQLERDEVLSGYVKDKIRYDYSRESDRLVVCMPTAVHKLFIARVEDAVFSQLKSIREGSGDAAAFAQKVYPARSTEIYFPVDDAPSATKSKREPDTSLWHDDAKYPGIIIGVAYSHKRKRLGRLAGDYLLDSNASVQAVVGLDIEYGKKRSRKATLSVWRTHVEGNELRAVQEVADEVFRNEQGHPTEHPGLRLQLSDFADKEPALRESRGKDREIVITTQQLCEYLDAAETKVARLKSLSEDSIAPGLKKRKRAETPPDQITSGDEAKYVGQEERAAKRMAEDETDTKTRQLKARQSESKMHSLPLVTLPDTFALMSSSYLRFIPGRDLGQDQFKILF